MLQLIINQIFFYLIGVFLWVGKDGNESGPSASSVTVPNILKKKKTESKSKMIQILKVCKENKSSQGIILYV